MRTISPQEAWRGDISGRRPKLTHTKALIIQTTIFDKGAYDAGLREAMRMVIDEFTLTYPGIKNVEHEYFYAVQATSAITLSKDPSIFLLDETGSGRQIKRLQLTIVRRLHNNLASSSAAIAHSLTSTRRMTPIMLGVDARHRARVKALGNDPLQASSVILSQ